MSFLSPLQESIVTVIGWSLVHSLWFGSVIACCAWIVAAMLRNANANTRYVILLLAFVSIPVAAIASAALMPRVPVASDASLAEFETRVADAAWTANEENDNPARFEEFGSGRLETGPNHLNDASRNPTTQSVSSAADPNPARPESLSRRVANWIPWLVGAWVTGVGLFSLRLLLSCVSLRRLLACGTPVSRDVADIAARVSCRIRLNRTIRVLESTLAEVPATIGFFRPVVLLPLSALSNLTAQELESILAHEVAHIYRCDFLVNVFQTLLDVLLFYHPAAWWLSRRIRQEREHACDDMAIAVTGNRLQYARALATVAEQTMRSRLALTADGGQFSNRIRRILRLPNTQSMTPSLLLSASLLAIVLLGTTLLLIPPAESMADNASAGASSQLRAEEFIEPISGIILGPDGNPLAEVTVYLRRRPFRYHSRPLELAQTTTDDDGRFEFHDVVIPQITDVYQKSVFPVDVIAMKAGHSIRWERLTNSRTDISIQLRKESLFRGVLRDDGGKLVAGAKIRVRNLMSLNTITQIDVAGGHTPSHNGDSFLDISQSVACIAATTDEDGRFILRELPNRVGMILGIDDDRFVDTQWYAATATEELPDIPAGKLIIPPRPETAGQIIQQRVRAELLPIHASPARLTATRGVHVRFRVLDDETGEPVAGATIALTGDGRSDVQTNGDGVCDVYRLVPESTAIATVRPPETSRLLGRRETLTLSADLQVEREVRLKQGAIVSGRVVDLESGIGVSNAAVSFVPEAGDVADSGLPVPATSDPAGIFRLVVPQVSGRVVVSRPPAGYLQPSATAGSAVQPVKSDSTVSARLDKPIEGLEIPLVRRPSIPFLFVDADGQPLAVTADVRLFSSSNSYYSSTEEVDESGMMDASLLVKSRQAPTAVQILARSADEQLAGFFRSKKSVELQGDQPHPIVLLPVASVKGRILDKETRRPIAGARVRLSVSYTATGGQGVGSFTCDKEGRYGFQELVPGMRYALGVGADGYAALNSIHTRFLAVEGRSHTVDIVLSPEKPKEIVDIQPAKTPVVDGPEPQEAYDRLAGAYDKAYSAYRDLLDEHESSQAKLQIGKAAPEIEGVDLDGKPMKLSDFRGQVVVIHYWESGLAFFSRLKALSEEYRDEPLVIVGVNTDPDRDLAIAAAAQQGLAIRHWHDPERVIHRRWSGSWPDTHVISHDGKLLYRGQRRSLEPLEDVLDRAIAAARQAETE